MTNKFKKNVKSSLTILLVYSFLSLTQYVTAQPVERPVFYLKYGTWELTDIKSQTGCQLLRELVRQSLLVSAELDYGWLPRDQSMGESMQPAYTGPQLELSFLFSEKEAFSFRVGLKDSDRSILSKVFPSSSYDVTVYKKVLRDADEHARVCLGPLMEPVNGPTEAILSTDETSYQISNLNFITLWLQLRDWNAEVHELGESPERLAALSRGYATFGLANYTTISHTAKASLARGLVYAQRLVERHPQQALSYYTRAYAWTLAGFDAFATEDLERAHALGGNAPQWLSVIKAYRTSDFDLLQQMIEGDDFNAQLAGLLATFATLNWEFSARYFQFMNPAVEQNPHNIQLYLMTGRGMGGVSARHRSTTTVFDAFDNLLRSRRGQLTILSSDAKDAISVSTWTYTDFYSNFMRGYPYEVPPSPSIDYPALFIALSRQARSLDNQTPSIESLAHLIRDYRLTMIYQRLSFRKYTWGVDSSEAVSKWVPSVSDHPYAPLLEAFAEDADIHALAKKVILANSSSSFYDMLNEDLYKKPGVPFADMNYRTASGRTWNNNDRNVFDYSWWLRSGGGSRNRTYIQQILAASPNSYMGINYALWDKELASREFVQKHETLINSSASATRKLGERFAKEGRYDEARKMYEQSLSIEPTRKATRALADLCLEQGDQEAWLKHMVGALDFPDNGLERANVNRDIADTLVSLGEWDQALPFAETGARSYSESTLMKAAWVHALLGNIEQAKEYMNACLVRYDEHPCYSMNLYGLFGIEPLEEADNILELRRIEFSPSNNQLKLLKAAAIEIFYGNDESAAKVLQKALEISNDPWPGLLAALILDDLGETELRDTVLQRAITLYPNLRKPSRNRKGMRNFIDLYIEINNSPELTEEQIHKVQEFARDYLNEGFNVEAHFFAGELLRLNGEDDYAQQLFIDILEPKDRDRIIEFLPSRSLRKMGVDPVHELQKKRKLQPGRDM